MSALVQLVTPGEAIAESSSHQAGRGSFSLFGQVRSAVVGIATTDATKIDVAVADAPLPVIGDVIIGRIEKVNRERCTISIISIGNHQLLEEPLPGILRQRDVRAYEVDSVEMIRCYRPGDIVRASVVRVVSTVHQLISAVL